MSERLRTIVVIGMVLLMAIFSFWSGYLANDYFTRRAFDSADMGLFGSAWLLVEENFIGELPTNQQINHGAIRGALRMLDDPYTSFLAPVARQEERETLRGNFGGIGAGILRNESGEMILEPIPGNPAEAAGILDGDVLLAVDGIEVPADETAESVANRIRGEIGTVVVLTVRHVDSAEPETIEIERGEILIPSVVARLLRQDQTIGYIQLTRFSGESGDEVANALISLLEQGATSFILDLRNNGGGLLDASVAVSNNFLSKQVVYHQVTRSEGEVSESTADETILEDEPLVLLVNGGTGSSAEIVAGALQDHQRAKLVGETTFGKGSVQLVFDLEDSSSIHVTWARWFTPNRRQIDQNGLEPDIVQTTSEEARAEGRDEQLARAIQLLQTGQ